MNNAEVVAVQVTGDGVFVEFADGLGSFFPGNFLYFHRESHPNQLFVSASDSAAARSAHLALPMFTGREAQRMHPSLLLT